MNLLLSIPDVLSKIARSFKETLSRMTEICQEMQIKGGGGEGGGHATL